MCLFIEVISPAADRATLDAAAVEASATGLRVDVGHASRWPWAKAQPVRARISEEGGCACSLLSDSADWEADTWSMRPEVLDRLATTLLVLATRGPTDLSVEALWAGDTARETVPVSRRALAAIAKAGELRTHTRYVVVADEVAEPLA